MQIKTCPKCDRELPPISFNKNKNTKDGLAHVCRTCVNKERKTRYLHDPEFRERLKNFSREFGNQHKEARKARAKAWVETNKGRDAFIRKRWRGENAEKVRERQRRATDRYRATERGKAFRKKWRENNPEKLRASNMQCRMRHKRGKRIPAEIIIDMWHKQKGLCIYCRTKLGNSTKDRDAYEIDHIIPVSKGGPHTPENLQLTCPPCNAKKAAKLPHEFAQQLGRLFF